MTPTHCLMIFEVFFLGFLIYGPRVFSAFLSRKLCHMLSGACMLLIDPSEVESRIFVYVVSVVSLLMTWEVFLPKLWFGSSRDVGITVYLVLVAVWFHLQLPVRVLAPVFFADPAGAIVGRYMTKKGKNAKLIGDKTVLGSMSVFLVAFFTLSLRGPFYVRFTVSLLTALVEAAGGKFDNLFIAIVSIFAWLLF